MSDAGRSGKWKQRLPPHPATVLQMRAPHPAKLTGSPRHAPHAALRKARPVVQRMNQPMDVEPDPHRAATFFRDEVKASYTGRNDSGVAFGTTILRPARSFASEPDAQFLRHISAFFFFYANHFLEKSDAEVEAMYVNNRLLLSANNPKTMEQLYNHMLKEPTLLDALRTVPTTGERRGTRVVDRFQNEIMSPDLTEDVQFLAQGLSLLPVRESLAKITIRASFREDVLTPPQYEEKLILVSGLDLHAEQKLLHVLINSKLPKDTPVVIRGKKRPCFGCWLCLYFVADVMGYTKLNYNTRPGKAWTLSIDGLKRIIDRALSLDVPKETMRVWGDKMIRMYAQNKIHSHVSTVSGSTAEDPGWDSESDDDEAL